MNDQVNAKKDNKDQKNNINNKAEDESKLVDNNKIRDEFESVIKEQNLLSNMDDEKLSLLESKLKELPVSLSSIKNNTSNFLSTISEHNENLKKWANELGELSKQVKEIYHAKSIDLKVLSKDIGEKLENIAEQLKQNILVQDEIENLILELLRKPTDAIKEIIDLYNKSV